MSSARLLGGGALVLGVLAVVAGSPHRSGRGVDIHTLAREVTDEADHVTAVELARWIRDRKPSLRVIDVRDSSDFEEYHIPRAEHIPLDRLVDTPFQPGETIVLYSGGGAHAAQGWVFLRSRGLTRVYFLRGGVDEWLNEVMNPQLPSSVRPSERSYLDSVAALSRYFGGTPRQVDSILPIVRSTVARTRGRGC